MTSRPIWFVLVGLIAASAGCDRATGPRRGSLIVTIDGLPAEVAAKVTITTPKQTTLTVSGTQTLPDLEPGKYQIAAANSGNEKSTFAPTAVTSVVEVVAGDTPTQVSVTYSVITALVSITINGQPAGTTPSVTIAGMGISKTVVASSEIGNLTPGEYRITAGNVDAGELFGGVATPSSLILAASTMAVPVTINYGAITGSLSVIPSGLPSGSAGIWDISGPGGFSRTLSGSGEVTVSHLSPGQYSISARNVSVGTDSYGSTAGPSIVTVIAGQSVSASFSYVLRAATFNLNVAAAYLVQSTQSLSGSVPLVAGRNAYLRVFVRGNEANTSTPQVRVRFFRSGQIVSTITIGAPANSVPMTIGEASATDSWGSVISGTMLTPGTSLLVDVDPSNQVREANESDNQYPSSGTPLALDIRGSAQMNVRFVPVVTGNGLIGSVTAGELARLMDLTLRMHPLSSVSADLRSPYTTANIVAGADSIGAGEKILSEIDAIRVAEGSGRYYVGIVKNNGNTRWAGIGYRPGRSVISIDTDYASETLAHEFGHNWGRGHVDCGSPAGVDPAYPYPGGVIGRYGFDIQYGRIMSSGMPDVMSYCRLPMAFNLANPRQWTSDYTYAAVFNYRSSQPTAIVSGENLEDCLILWGRVTRTGLILEPSFVAKTKAELPAQQGRFHVAARDASGVTVYDMSFDPQQIDDGSSNQSHFAFAVPLSRLPISRVASLELNAPGTVSAIVRETQSEGGVANVTVTSSGSRVRFKWDVNVIPLLVLRDAVTNEIVSLATSGDVSVLANGHRIAATGFSGVRPMSIRVVE